MPSIKEADDGGKVRIGAVNPSGNGMVRCDGCGGPSICRMNYFGGGREEMSPMYALPPENVYTMKYAKHFLGLSAAPVAMAKPPQALFDFCK